jgi:hypothetical protein
MTSTRWWAPAGPHIGPDDADLGLLRASGSNPRLDLGAALVAAHRVGAAALMDAARTPLVDSRTVIAKLADARSRLGLPLSESVSKSVGDRRYAMVLVRDFLDDADMAAHDLFRAAVAKRVPPTVAAQRVAAVYGVDARGLGQYRTIALDPRAHPQAVADAADRALFGFIEKVAETEADDREEVSKAPAAEQERPVTRTASRTSQDDPQTPYWDARNDKGEFAPKVGAPSVLARLRERYGIGGQQAPEVDSGRPTERAAQEEEPSPTKGKSMAEIRRELEAKRKQGPKRRPKTRRPEPEQLQRSELERGQLSRPGMQRSGLKLTPLQKQQLTKVAAKSTAAEPELEVVESQRNHPFLEHLGSSEDYRHIPQDMLVHATDGQAMEFLSRLATAPGRVGRIGHLFEYTGGNTAEESGTRTAGEQLRGYARDADGTDPRTEYIPADALSHLDTIKAQQDFLEGKKREMATRNGHLDRGRLEQISALPSNDDEGMVLVDESENAVHGTPTVFEFVVEDGQGRVDSGEGSKHMQWTLDPDQAYKFAAPEQWETTFDYELGVLVKRVRATAVGEREVHEYRTGIRKAAAEAERPRVQEGLAVAPDGTRYYDVRDDQGQFTASPSIAQRLKDRKIVPPAAAEPVGAPPPAKSMAQLRAERQNKRRQGPKRRQKPKPEKIIRDYGLRPTGMTRGQLQRPGMERGEQLRRPGLANALSELVATRSKPERVLNDHTDYVVLSGREARDNFGLHGEGWTDHGLWSENSETLLEFRTSGDDAGAQIAEMAHDQTRMKEIALLDYPSDEPAAALEPIVDRFLEQMGGVGMVEAKKVGVDMISVRVNTTPLHPVVLVELDPAYADANTLQAGYDYNTIRLTFASRTVIQHDEMFEDGTVRSYAVPVERYIAAPGSKPEGRR